MYAVLAKGLIGSRTNPNAGVVMMPDPGVFDDKESIVTQVSYIYFLLYLAQISDHSIERLKSEIYLTNSEYEIDTFCGERYGLIDSVTWLSENDIEVEIVSATYPKQREASTEFYGIVSTGRFKSPPIVIPGSKNDDILHEEMSHLDHDPDKKWFGSPEKKEKYGVQDDAMYAIAWAFHGGRFKTVDDFRPRTKDVYFGTMLQPKDLVRAW